MTQVVKVDAKEFGLEEAKAKVIETQFAPALIEQEALITMYETLIKSELDKNTVKQADNLRKRLKGVRTHVERIRKAEKNFYLAGGRFVDAWAKKSIEPILIMEEKMTEMSDYYKNLEKERIEKLQLERSGKLISFEVENIPQNLGEMDVTMWDAYILGVETNYKAKKEAERKAEEERLKAERQAKIKAEEERKEQERIRLENERLKKEAEEKEALRIKQESERKAKEEAERKTREEKARKEREAYEAKLKAEREAREKELAEIRAKQEAKDRAEREERERLAKIEADKQAKIKAEQEAKLQKEREEKAKLEAELKAKKDAEEKAKKEAEDKAKQLLLAPDKDKLKAFAKMLSEIEVPEIKDPEMKRIADNSKGLLDKVKNYILERV